MPPKVNVEAWTTEPVVETPGSFGQVQRVLAVWSSVWSSYNRPKSVEPGTVTIERKMGERYAVDLYNLALKEGYESELVRYRHFGGPSFTVTVRRRGDESPYFMSDSLVPELGGAMPKTSGHFSAYGSGHDRLRKELLDDA